MPRVSVIIPTFRRPDFLREAIASVLAQTFQDYDVIIVDDASGDGTEKVVKSFHSDRIRYIQHQTNKGGAESRNTGIKNAHSEYIAFLDDDDRWLPRKLELQIGLLEKSSNEVGAVYTGCLRIERDSGKLIGSIIPTKKGRIFESLLARNWVGSTSSVLLKRECFEKVGLFDTDLSSQQDYDLWLRVSQEFKFTYIREPLLIYNCHNNKISINPEKLAQGLQTMISKWGKKSSILRKRYCHRYIKIGVLYCLNGQTRKGRQACYRAIKMYPFRLQGYLVLALSLLGTDNFKKMIEMKRRITEP